MNLYFLSIERLKSFHIYCLFLSTLCFQFSCPNHDKDEMCTWSLVTRMYIESPHCDPWCDQTGGRVLPLSNPVQPPGDHTLHGYCGKCSFDKSTAADGRWVKPSNTPEINLWPLRQWSITQQAVGHPRSIRVAIHPSNGVPLRASPQVQMSGCGHFGYAFVQTPGASGKIWHNHEDSEKFSSGKKRFRRM